MWPKGLSDMHFHLHWLGYILFLPCLKKAEKDLLLGKIAERQTYIYCKAHVHLHWNSPTYIYIHFQQANNT